ncbi:MarR family winged helix-turn-helix transcriptional regulator [Micromonospora sp. A3M-1-15]|uniref:MarR family winged helix-turn-helix transcriptional regulator n=1 Tax=Micromonospora sp. A3M-1-15 TaxID=2962035 RepID=UPI0020B67707|nr:MarR family winged helix-turn-helix transcriptional regulator [Micromonospora sp. A3M-1-15]MCP3785237.1 MarR family winged helix-turn-helix transcriptional regulator [Micromonospora sp. A3M-1-15]
MTETHTESPPAHSAFKVLAALAELGQATAAEVAEHAGLGYSTTTPKLRAWEGSGQAERFRTGDGRTLWRLTDAGRAATAASPQPAPTDAPAPAAEPETSDPPAAQLEAAEAQLQPGDADPPAAADTTGPSSSDTASQQQPELDAPHAGESTAGNVADKPTDPACQAPAGSHDSGDGPRGEGRSAAARRRGGSLRGAVLDILEAHPDRAYRTGELCKLIDAANAGTGAAKASAGAVANAAIKLVASGKAVQTVERPATFQLAPANGGE